MMEDGFEGLDFYRESLTLVKAAYQLAGQLPELEKYGLASQLRRASASVPLNIAEGYGRYRYLDRLRFLYIARGSLQETLSGFIVAHAVGYIDSSQLTWARDLKSQIERKLNEYCRFVRQQAQGQTEYGDNHIREDEIIYETE
jgi:four helix bundle protein